MAITERYVDASAAGGGDGTTSATSGANGAFTWAEMITDINTPRVGYRYNIKSGTYSLASSSNMTGDGTATSPNILRGYSATIGDGYLGRGSGGQLTSTNMPVIAYATNTSLSASGANYTVYENLKFTGSTTAGLVALAGDCILLNCIVEAGGTGAGSAAVSGTTRTRIVNSDLSSVGVSTTPTVSNFTGDLITGCRITSTNGFGIQIGTVNIRVTHNTIYDCITGIDSIGAGSTLLIDSNTISNCSGDGINIVTLATSSGVITNNHITGCGGYAIDLNAPSTYYLIAFNRFRDWTTAAVRGGGDWESAGSNTVIDSGSTGTDADDYTNKASDDYSLVSTASGINTGVGYLNNIGANGTPVVTGGGGGPLVGGRLVR